MALRQISKQLTQRLGLGVSPAWQLSFARAYAEARDGLKYNKSHEWAKVDGDVATVGLSDFAQAELGDVVYVELPEVGTEVEQGNNFGVVESVKAASDTFSPVTGEVVETNQKLVDEPGTVNKSPFDDGWLMKVKVTDKGQLDSLLDADAYKAECESH